LRRGRHDGVTTAGVGIDEPSTFATAQPRTRSPDAPSQAGHSAVQAAWRSDPTHNLFPVAHPRGDGFVGSVTGTTCSSKPTHRERCGTRRASASGAPLQSSGSGSGKPIKKLAATAIKYRGDAHDSRHRAAIQPGACGPWARRLPRGSWRTTARHCQCARRRWFLLMPSI